MLSGLLASGRHLGRPAIAIALLVTLVGAGLAIGFRGRDHRADSVNGGGRETRFGCPALAPDVAEAAAAQSPLAPSLYCVVAHVIAAKCGGNASSYAAPVHVAWTPQRYYVVYWSRGDGPSAIDRPAVGRGIHVLQISCALANAATNPWPAEMFLDAARLSLLAQGGCAPITVQANDGGSDTPQEDPLTFGCTGAPNQVITPTPNPEGSLSEGEAEMYELLRDNCHADAVTPSFHPGPNDSIRVTYWREGATHTALMRLGASLAAGPTLIACG